MKRYANRGGGSGIVAYEIGAGRIAVAFGDGWCYLYTDDSAGAGNVARMQALARDGHGLNGFINREVRGDYAEKYRPGRAPAG